MLFLPYEQLGLCAALLVIALTKVVSGLECYRCGSEVPECADPFRSRDDFKQQCGPEFDRCTKKKFTALDGSVQITRECGKEGSQACGHLEGDEEVCCFLDLCNKASSRIPNKLPVFTSAIVTTTLLVGKYMYFFRQRV